MGHKLHIKFAVVFAVIMALVALWLRSYAPYSGRHVLPKQPPAIVLAMEDVHLVGLGHNGKLWSAKAESVVIGQDRCFTKLKKIKDGKIYEADKVVLRASAGEALYDTYRKNLTLQKGIKITGRDGQQISGEGALWNSSNMSLRSMGEVNFKSKYGSAKAQKLALDLRNQELTMWNVSMKINIDDAAEIANGKGQ